MTIATPTRDDADLIAGLGVDTVERTPAWRRLKSAAAALQKLQKRTLDR